MPCTRIGIVDDHLITRRALEDFLREQEGFEVVAQAGSGRAAIDLSRAVPMDVMLLDIEMPGQTGFDCLGHVLAHAPRMAVLMLSAHSYANYGPAMLKKGASGYLNKQCDPAEIVSAIRTVAGGRNYVSSEMEEFRENASSPGPARHSKLTPREFQVMVKLARGRSPWEVGAELSLSERTVSAYRVKIVRKLEAHTNGDLTYYALKHGLIG